MTKSRSFSRRRGGGAGENRGRGAGTETVCGPAEPRGTDIPERHFTGRTAASRRNLARVLVVEDEPTSLDAVRRFLEFRGHDVSAAASAREALKAAERFDPQVLVCDWQLDGGADGVDLAEDLQRNHKLAVIMVTAHRLESLKEKVRRFSVEVSAYRRKPVSLASLAEIIESLEYPGSRQGNRQGNRGGNREAPG